jgi:hypothetical protein
LGSDNIHVHGWMAVYCLFTWSIFIRQQSFLIKKISSNILSTIWRTLDAELINKVKFDGIMTLLTYWFGNYLRKYNEATINHSDGIIISSENLSLKFKIYTIFRQTFFTFAAKDEFVSAYTFLQINL